MEEHIAKKEEPADTAAAKGHCLPAVTQALTVDNFRLQALQVLESVLKEHLGPRQYLLHHLGDVGSEACREFAAELATQYPQQPGAGYSTLSPIHPVAARCNTHGAHRRPGLP